MEGRRIVVVGGGTSGWLTAALAVGRAAALGDARVTLVEAPDVPTIGVGEGSTPHMGRFMRGLGIADTRWMPAAGATRKMGIRFDGWGRGSYFHPFFFRRDLDAYRRLEEGDPLLFARLARARRATGRSLDETFVTVGLTREPLFPRYLRERPDAVRWGAYHFDAGLLGRFLAGWAREQGVEHRLARVVGVRRRADGGVAALELDRGEPLEGDLFFDCTGFRSLLLGGELGEPFVDYDELLCDRAVAAKVPLEPGAQRPAPYTVATALDAGWAWEIPLRGAVGCGYVYSSAHLGDDEAEAELGRFLARRHGAGAGAVPRRRLRFRSGRRRRAWVRNCVGVGLSASFIEPLEATSIALSMVGVARCLLALGRDGASPGVERRAYNREIGELHDAVRDFIVLHYATAGRRDTSFWRACHGEAAVPGSLAPILEGWRRRGRLDVERSFFPRLSWLCILAGGDHCPPEPAGLGRADGGEELLAHLGGRAREGVAEYRRRMAAALDEEAKLVDPYCVARASSGRASQATTVE